MKKVYILFLMVAGLSFTACSSDDNSPKRAEELKGSNTVTFIFDHKMLGENIVYDQQYAENNNKESLSFNFIKYIVSNFVLIDEEGKAFTYDKAKSYFIIDSKTDDFEVTLTNVPAGKYRSVKFGIGVDQEKYLRGEEEQQEFWDLCSKHGLVWSWITGYKFINTQGEFIVDNGELSGFQLHIGSHGSKLDNYRDLVLNTPKSFVISDDYAAKITVELEASKLLDSKHQIPLKDKPFIMVDAERAPMIMDNAQTMFSISHIEVVK
ncbi:MbnP family protein [Myroides pelagicus]|uniref:Copper-binding protein MbnP-like domain-containing protein n=1 Tax=Myroides pelagicus TaxID=270914 RepID=A0A7K1GQW7_9FLAO|nr:MbnP family protein [Myroides pelagicus]MEC4114504.1 MbnP family protein [Myroides pelagicus]MTH30544.1 hypothetical protein [Myroides pelagicus]